MSPTVQLAIYVRAMSSIVSLLHLDVAGQTRRNGRNWTGCGQLVQISTEYSSWEGILYLEA